MPAPAGLLEIVPAPVPSVETVPVAPGPEFTAAGDPGFVTRGTVDEGATVLVCASAGTVPESAARMRNAFTIFSNSSLP